MKVPLFSLFLLLAISTALRAEPGPAPFITGQIKELTKQIDSDLASGALTQPDADELKQATKHVQSILDSEPSLTPRTRRDLREQLSRIWANLHRKEGQAKALASPSAASTP